jgi:hypothetical protein
MLRKKEISTNQGTAATEICISAQTVVISDAELFR